MPEPWFCGRWECTSGNSNKFYEIHSVRGSYEEFECTYGAIGSNGNIIVKDFFEVLKKVNAFASKGYHQVVLGSNGNWPTQTPKAEPVAVRSRLASVRDEDEDEKPKDKPKEEKPKAKGRLASI